MPIVRKLLYLKLITYIQIYLRVVAHLNKMTGIRISALIFLIISHLCLVAMFVFENELQNVEFPYFFIIWGIGIFNAGLNIYYGVKIELKTWILILLIISGIVWFFPPLLMTYFGFPFLLIFLAIGIYLHTKKGLELKTNE